MIEDDANRTNFETLIQTISPKEVVFEKGGISKASTIILKEVKAILVPIKEKKEFTTLDDIKEQIVKSEYFKEWPKVLKNYDDNEIVMKSFQLMMNYLNEIKLDKELFSMGSFQNYNLKNSNYMVLDGQTLINLEILKNSKNGIIL
jgi:DNA mismatch repair protein MSH6